MSASTSSSPLELRRPLWALSLVISALLSACGDRASQATATPAPPPAPIVQGQQLRFAAGHPQLALLGTQAAKPAQDIQIELPARLVWNEERTQRLYPAFSGRVAAILADVGHTVTPGTTLARLASPEFGQAQADTARALADDALAQKTLARQRELYGVGIVARKDKIGFEPPEKAWILSIASQARAWLSEDVQIPFIRREMLLAQFDDVIAGRRAFSWQVWRWINFYRWKACVAD